MNLDPDQTRLSLAQTVPETRAEGPGRRFAIWFQGCPLRCPGCCNPEMLPFSSGQEVSIAELMDQIACAARGQGGEIGGEIGGEGVEGITLLGGEPLAHASSAAVLAREVQALDLSVMVFSGYKLEEIRAMHEPAVDELLRHTDILVDGPYVREFPETTRRWIGSANQRIHFFTDRYRPDDPCWRQPNTLELRLTREELSVNGFPPRHSAIRWKREPLA